MDYTFNTNDIKNTDIENIINLKRDDELHKLKEMIAQKSIFERVRIIQTSLQKGAF